MGTASRRAARREGHPMLGGTARGQVFHTASVAPSIGYYFPNLARLGLPGRGIPRERRLRR